MILYSLITALYLLHLCVNATSHKILVILENIMDQYQFSNVFHHFERTGYSLSYYAANSPFVELKSFGMFNYDSVFIFLNGKAKIIDKISKTELYEFSESGGNVVYMMNHLINKNMQELMAMYGMYFIINKSTLMDPKNSFEILDLK